MSNHRETRLLEVQDIKKHFSVKGSASSRGTSALLRAVDGVSFFVDIHETFALVGESGCGKTTTGRLALGVTPPTGGSVDFEGKDLSALTREEKKDFRTSVQAVFQDPTSSLDPRMRVGPTVGEPLLVNRMGLSKREISDRVEQLLLQVGLDPKIRTLYPHELSGGMLQRVALARALALRPKLIVLDEPLSSLDVSIQAQVANLLKDIQVDYGVGYLLIAHNLATVRYMSDRVGVMYLGKLIEVAPSENLFTEPVHPYTQGLIQSSLPSHPKNRRDIPPILGEIPSPLAPPSGCSFHPRCQQASKVCSQEEPELKEIRTDHTIACHLC